MAKTAHSIRILCVLLAGLLCQPAAANTASDFFEDGNRLFRDDLYWAALLRYRQAREAGLDTPLLAYNTGVAHYKAGQYERAATELKRAATSTRLAPLSHYNLGLSAYRSGSNDEALRWLRLARDQEQNKQVASLARKALQVVRASEREADTVTQRVEKRKAERERRFTDLDIRTSVGFGNNNNVYRSPSTDYIDFAQAAQPLVTPTIVSGAFMPVDLSLRYNVNSLPFEGFFTAYRLRAKYYQDKELDNANEFVHEFSFGNEYKRERNGVRSRVWSAFRIAQHEETYFDPDNGDIRVVNGVEIGDRLNFRRYGPILRFRRTGEYFGFGGIVEGQLRNYEDVEVVPEYDHNFFRLGLHAQFKFTPTSLLRIDVEGLSRRYGDRPSFDLDGRQRPGNPSVEYDYLVVSATARQRVTRSFWFGVEFEHTDRTDGYVGYFDYVRDSFKAEISWSPGRRLDVDAYGRYSLYDYPNAFAFNNETLNRRTLETLSAGLRADWRLSWGLSLRADLRLRETTSNDQRIQYDQNEFMLSIVWEQ